MTMDCKLADNLLQDYLDDELTEELRDQVRAHLIRCRRCAWEVESIRQALSALRESALPAAAGEDLRDRLLLHLLRDHRAAVAGQPYIPGIGPFGRQQEEPFVLELASEEGGHAAEEGA
jgi:anti-sigma factor RsiW